ncbi:MAG: TonB-dependent receptor [Bryobacterales bacterium]|nr:TonB-dependent receptor [Bryobacterales bacterium]
MLSARVGFLMAVLGLFLPAVVLGQATANIVGTVKDTSEGGVPGARVTAVNVQTGLRATRESGTDGSYSIPLLPAGQYRLEVEKEGFQRYSQSGIMLAVGDNVRLDAILTVGSVAESVTVTATAPLLETETGTIRGLVDQQRIVDLPLNGRRVTNLMQIQAGVIQRSSGTSEGDAFVVNGSRQSGVYFTLDGGMNTDSYRNYSGVFPNPDAVQEVSIQKSNFSAEYANATGAVVTVATKSGTNEFHGSAFEFLRNAVFNARNFFAARRDSLKRSQFGGTLGGPIIKDKLFFFGSYQGTRTRSDPQLTRQFLPTAAIRQGRFSGPITDPQTQRPFPDNQIPAARLNPVTLELLKYIPDPGTPDGQRFVGVPNKDREDEYTAKADANLGAHRLMGRFFRQRYERPFTGNVGDLASMFASDVGRSNQPYQQLTINDIFTASPQVLNSATFALRWRRTHNDWTSVDLPIDFARAGVKGIAVKDPASIYVNISGGFLARPGWNYDKRDYDIHIADTVTWIRSSHEIKFGGEVLRSKNDIRNDFRTMGLFNFNGNITGNPFADFMLGEVYQFDQGGGEYKELYGTRWGFFAQDTWRTLPNLTLTLGLRWDPMFPFHDDLGRTQCFVPGASSVRFPNAPTGYLNDGDPGCPTGGFDSYWQQIAPRFGFAWRLTGRSVVRGGFGLFWNPQFTVLYNGFVNAAPFSPQVTRFGVRLDDPYGPAANPFPAAFAPFNPPADAEFFTPLGSFGTFARDFKPSYMETFNLTLEHEVARNLVARASYIGNLGRRLSYTDDLNYARYAPGATTGNIQQRRPYGDFGAILTTYSAGTSSYHGLQLSMERRVTRGFSFEVNYTFSKSIDETSADTTPQNPSQTVPMNRTLNRGVSDFDQRHRLVASHVWSLPELSGQNAVVRGVLGGWQFSGITTIRSGGPFSVRSGTDRALSGLGSTFADVIGDPFLDNGRSRAERIARYFNTSAFSLAKLGTFGTSPRNIMRGPGAINFDFGLMKIFPLTEQVRLQFRAEMFNAFNTPNFNNPFANVNTPSRFGRIEGAGSPRIMQFAMKISF